MTKTLTEQLKAFIEKSGLSIYRISLESGVGQNVLGRFMSGESDMKLSNADKVANALHLELVQRKGPKKGK